MIRLKIKLPDNLSDKEMNDIVQKYIAVMPCKSFKFIKAGDSWEWLI
jgi:hypothetical protein